MEPVDVKVEADDVAEALKKATAALTLRDWTQFFLQLGKAEALATAIFRAEKGWSP